MLTKIIVIILFLLILYFLGSALYYTLRYRVPSKDAAKALTWRIAFSLLLFALLIASYYLGWINPHPLLTP